MIVLPTRLAKTNQITVAILAQGVTSLVTISFGLNSQLIAAAFPTRRMAAYKHVFFSMVDKEENKKKKKKKKNTTKSEWPLPAGTLTLGSRAHGVR